MLDSFDHSKVEVKDAEVFDCGSKVVEDAVRPFRIGCSFELIVLEGSRQFLVGWQGKSGRSPGTLLWRRFHRNHASSHQHWSFWATLR
jgi:hypothetical protein